jgi:hypothetical protein
MKAPQMGSRNLGKRAAGWDSVEDGGGRDEIPTLALSAKNL